MDRDNKNNNEIDLSSELKDSEAKFQGRQEEQAQGFLPGTPKIIQWLINHSKGLIKNKRQVAYILMGFVVLAIIIVLFLFFSEGNNNAGEVPVNQFVPH